MRTRTKKAPGFLLARLSLYLVGAATAAFGVVGWFSPEAGIAEWALMGLTALSALVVPFTIEILGRSWFSAFLLAPALVFGGINAYSVHHAVEAKIEAPRKALYMAAAERAVTDAAFLVTEARRDLKALAAPVSQQVPGSECRCPQTQLGVRQSNADNLAAWQVQRDLLAQALSGAEASEAKAKAELKAAGKTYKPMVADLLVWIISAAIDASLALGLAGIALTRARIQARIDAEKPKARRKKKKLPVVSEQEKFALLAARGPRVVVSN